MASYKAALSNKEYVDKDCLLAVRGQRIPQALGEEITRLCVIRGIRYHQGFAAELRGLLPSFTRALNARDIMSNKIPDMNDPNDFPYCIWYPDTATEETYRALVDRYPRMKYQVGRACAVAGYVRLFKELDLLPECHIAEEARHNQQLEIYDAVMKPEVRYNAMDDYTRAVFPQPLRGCLNGDTAVRSYLEVKTKFRNPISEDDLFGIWFNHRRSSYFDITEDDRIDEYTSEEPHVEDDVSHLLYTPLPPDLPTLNKDVLILMAAYYGDIDRYSRLRRPTMAESELACVVRGIYHNTMFAKWWSLQPGELSSSVAAAINARSIMNNDLSRITPETRHLPYCIWYPSVPHPSTCRELFRRVPSMKPAIARICILADYPETWDLLDADPDVYLMDDARASHNPKYLRDLESRLDRGCSTYEQDLSKHPSVPRHRMFEYTTTAIHPNVADNPCVDTDVGVPYDGVGASLAMTELSVSIPDELKKLGKEVWDNEGTHLYLNEYYDSLAGQDARKCSSGS